MRIALDPWVLDQRFRSAGSYVYAYNVFRQLRSMASGDTGVEFRMLVSSGNHSYGRELFPPKAGFNWQRTSLLEHYRLWRLGGASISARQALADVLFAPTFQVVPVGSIPVVTTIHDATPVLSPAWSSRLLQASTRFFMAAATRLSRSIITASKWSKKDLVEVYGLPESKVHVVYLGHNEEIFNRSLPDPESLRRCREKFGIERNYILHHGFIQPRKNLVRLVQAYRELIERRGDLDLELVLAGRIGWENEPLLAEVEKTNQTRGKVILTKETTEAELGLLVKGATLEVIPSLYEGFCLPMVEAMACGTPAIVANTSCLPEISGGVLEYFDPLSVQEICATIEHVVDNRELQTRLSIEGAKWANALTWRRCAEETMRVITSAAGGPGE
ncbi:MAG TPA: glycosyltransferase family 1 protein [Candidatus Angelobacter sp.]|jgi:glycosyltransferase involved in cell wall biosynthesis|nr:glycosyltransferase family 1 protein [Candidatus Angelobacter sp.]